jgi:hypothetical protein
MAIFEKQFLQFLSEDMTAGAGGVFGHGADLGGATETGDTWNTGDHRYAFGDPKTPWHETEKEEKKKKKKKKKSDKQKKSSNILYVARRTPVAL